MITDLPAWIPWLMALAAVASLFCLVWAAFVSGTSRTVVALFAAACALILAVQGWMAGSGFYLSLSSLPPRFVAAAPPAIVILLGFVFFAFRRGAAPLRALTLLHTVRIPVEIVLWQLFVYGHVPKLMTFEGINPDILSGLTAPFAAWIGTGSGRVRRGFLIVWNLAALVLLFNIVFHAVLSVPTPFQRYGFDQPNTGVLYFPFIWLPAFIVPAVFASHVWSLRELCLPKR